MKRLECPCRLMRCTLSIMAVVASIIGQVGADTLQTAPARPDVVARMTPDGLAYSVYSSGFSCTDWTGDLQQHRWTANGSNSRQWSARERNQGARLNIMIADTTADSGLKPFTWDNLDDEQQGMLHRNPEAASALPDGRGRERLDYILGERQHEGTGQAPFRQRASMIGAIHNASPVLVSSPPYLAHLADAIENRKPRDSYRSYDGFRQSPSGTGPRRQRLYIGANDGMLHGIDAETGLAEFAFIPSAVMANLYRLTDRRLGASQPAFFVDGSPVVRDAYFGDGIGWRSVLVGTLGAGGRALFALDITDPDAIRLLWEFDDSAEQGDPDLGYSLPRPEIVRLHSGQWAVLQGNGPGSRHARAALLVIDIRSGRLLAKLTTPSTDASPNGLGSVRAADNNSDGLADYAYAGDLQGNLWRFDLIPTGIPARENETDPLAPSSIGPVQPSDFKLAYQASPLFSAHDAQGRRQPILLPPTLIRHPEGLGYLILLGTGRRPIGQDETEPAPDASLYAIHDRKTKGQATRQNDTGARRSNLLSQYLDTGQGPSHDEPPAAHRGWKLDLPTQGAGTGGQIIAGMTRHHHTLLFSSQSHDPLACTNEAPARIHAIDARNGGRIEKIAPDSGHTAVVALESTGAGFTLASGGMLFVNAGSSVTGYDLGEEIDPVQRQSWMMLPEGYR